MYNLTPSQKGLLRWIVNEVRKNLLSEQFTIVWTHGGTEIVDYSSPVPPELNTDGCLKALEASHLLINEKIQHGIKCTLRGKAYEAVDSNFDAPDTSFIKHLTPLADISGLDKELKERCLPKSNDPKDWDSAIRTACVVLENRLREIGGISDGSIGIDLVNKIFSEKGGTLAGKFTGDTGAAKRQGYRDLFAGIFGVFRNPIAHRFVDPTPEGGGAIITFVNLLLKMLEDLRPHS
jgi:uncharacterized protein (TIGR02391 family)